MIQASSNLATALKPISCIGGVPKFPSVDLDIDITVDYSQESSIDWGRGFRLFLVDSEVKLPDEQQFSRARACRTIRSS